MTPEARLKKFLEEAKVSVLTSQEDCANYGSDWTKTPGHAAAVGLPKNTQEVSEVLKLCNQLEMPVVPSGGRTGLAGGAVAKSHEIVLSLSRMTRIDPVDEIARSVRVEAGVTTQSIHEHCQAVGLTWPIDIAAKGSSQIGGNLATNAGGVRVIRYGMARKWVVGLEAVTIRGEILNLNPGLEKNNTGYDLIQLLIGSEGTLAVITGATLKLTRLPKQVWVLLFPLPNLESILQLFYEVRRSPFEILAFEFFCDRCARAVREKLGRAPRLTSTGKFYALLELENSASGQDIEAWLENLLAKDIVQDGYMARTPGECRETWALREGITESIQMTGPVKKYDLSVPLSTLIDFLAQARSLAERFRFDLYLFGHLGDGSPHLNLVKPEALDMQDFLTDCAEFEKALLPLLKKVQGSISAEHGVGLLKKHWLEYSRSPEELRLMREIKKSFDPKNLLNPGKLI